MAIPITSARRARSYALISPHTCNTCIYLRDNRPHPCICVLDGEPTKRQSWCAEWMEKPKKGKFGLPKA